MNLYQLMTASLNKAGITDPDASDRSEYSNVLKDSLNEAYRKICREKLHPWKTEAITLDSNKCFDFDNLSEKFVGILKISLYEDFSSSASGNESAALPWALTDNEGGIYIPNATAGGTVYVKYEYMPKPLEATYMVSGANTSKTIPVSEAISADEATALVGKKLYLIDVSEGTYTEYTITSAAAGAAGAATITVSETIGTATAALDEIYIGDNWTPKFNEDYHVVLTYWGAAGIYDTMGINYIPYVRERKQQFIEESGYITPNVGESQSIQNAYYPLNGSASKIINPLG